MRIAMAKSAAVFRHKQFIAVHHWLHSLVVHPDPFWSIPILAEWSGVHVAN